MTSESDVQTSKIAMVGLIGVIAVFAIIVAVQALYFRYIEYQLARDAAQPDTELSQVVAQQQAVLGSYRWIDQKKGVVGIAIDRAVERVVTELNRPPDAVPAARSPGKPPSKEP
jgi:hypothetical protein